MGLSIAILGTINCEYELFIAGLICLLSGVLAAQIEENARFYALLSGSVSLPFFLITHGADDGFFYFLGAFFVYAIVGFSITLGIQNTFYNGKVLFNYLFQKR
ncbi:hypothetical protein JYB87_11135 [Shewanella avicenniae]|uniref:Uncharacterized protein n=1 Tax=Shewanella avicenniae TaxID=2814294 RepID=A0ABX7QLJ6_9GAMM|nr:hypothetical protein [Shewanella avicenniae]QSX32326.1 hypothetical protein JYB87_11135 [Shewanella avicenniae]